MFRSIVTTRYVATFEPERFYNNFYRAFLTRKGVYVLGRGSSGRWVCLMGIGSALLAGCNSIYIEPTCPSELLVGASGQVAANEQNPGAIATYQWEVFPTGYGTFTDATQPVTTFQAAHEGEVVIRLTASDGLFQMVSSCVTRIRTIDVADDATLTVSLMASPSVAAIGEEVTLTCVGTGAAEPASFAIAQISGPSIELTEVSSGVSTFVPTESGGVVVTCVGEDLAGQVSDPAQITVLVTAAPDDDDTSNSNDNSSSDDDSGGRR